MNLKAEEVRTVLIGTSSISPTCTGSSSTYRPRPALLYTTATASMWAAGSWVSAIVELGKRSIRSLVGHCMPTQASALAYQGLFALFPFILCALSLSLQASKNSRKWDKVAQARFIDRAFTEE
jgi:hypothetical protein